MLAVTETAQSKIHEIIQNESDLGNVIRVVARKIAPYRFDYDLYFIEEDEIESGDVRQEINGLVFVADAESSRHLEGASIDYVEGPSATGFKLDNPNASSRIQGVRPVEVVRMLEAGESFEFIDARPAAERAKVSIVMARALDEVYAAELEAAPRERKLVLLGHHSTDGRTAARPFEQKGFKEVWYVVGGIDAWSTMDPSVPRY